MKIAVEGCAHGELETIYRALEEVERRNDFKIDLLICCGDFQASRNLNDLETMAVPKKFREMGTYYKYYSGELRAPILTIFVGGNHEAMNHMQELPYGGWVAPNIFYMGYAGVVRVKGVRIAGLSGIFKEHDYHCGRFEYSPYTEGTRRSVYHVRQLDVFRLKQLSGDIDIFISHDWPRGIYEYGNKEQLLRFKPHFRTEVQEGRLGSKAGEELLMHLKPPYWLAAHMHCKFAAIYPHGLRKNSTGNVREYHVTKFLSLDKCLPKRRFLQIFDIELEKKAEEAELVIEYDLEWLAILYLTNHLLGVRCINYFMPMNLIQANGERVNYTPTEKELNYVHKRFAGNLCVPLNFCRTVDSYNPNDTKAEGSQPIPQVNPQTTRFCSILGVDDPLTVAMVQGGRRPFVSNMEEYDTPDSTDSLTPMRTPKRKSKTDFNLPDPVDLDPCVKTSFVKTMKLLNEDEIVLSASSDEEDFMNTNIKHKKEPEVCSYVNEPSENKQTDGHEEAAQANENETQNIGVNFHVEPGGKEKTDTQEEAATHTEDADHNIGVYLHVESGGNTTGSSSATTSTGNTSTKAVFKRRNKNVYKVPEDENPENSETENQTRMNVPC